MKDRYLRVNLEMDKKYKIKIQTIINCTYLLNNCENFKNMKEMET